MKINPLQVYFWFCFLTISIASPIFFFFNYEEVSTLLSTIASIVMLSIISYYLYGVTLGSSTISKVLRKTTIGTLLGIISILVSYHLYSKRKLEIDEFKRLNEQTTYTKGDIIKNRLQIEYPSLLLLNEKRRSRFASIQSKLPNTKILIWEDGYTNLVVEDVKSINGKLFARIIEKNKYESRRPNNNQENNFSFNLFLNSNINVDSLLLNPYLESLLIHGKFDSAYNGKIWFSGILLWYRQDENYF